MLVLGIETSCDETAVALVEDGTTVRSNVIGTQFEHHRPFGGVVPEIAARAHLDMMLPAIDRAFVEAGATYADVEGVAVTAGPGLVGALLVGVAAAKSIALAHDLPFIGVNHLEGHVCATQLEFGHLEPPMISLIVSGGHTSLVLLDAEGRFETIGQTIDDAAGEAFDKIARFMGLPFPGGPEIDKLGRTGDPTAIAFPRAMMNDGTLDFSMSGLKTAVIRELRRRDAVDGRSSCPTSPHPSTRPSSTCWSPRPCGPPRPTTSARSPSSAGWRPTAGCARPWPTAAPGPTGACSCPSRSCAPTTAR